MRVSIRTLLFIFITINCFSQSSEINGIVLDISSNKPVPFATIAVYKDSILIDGTSTSDKGTFTLHTNLEYTSLEISFIGYHSQKIKKSDLQIPFVVKLVPSSSALEEVTILASNTTSHLEIDRKIIRLGTDIQNAGTTALEAFDQIAEIQTDLSTGSLNLRGSTNVRLLVNGKPSSLNPTEILEQLPSSSINRIELITVPSVKYQADGISGIINIILNKNSTYGMNVNVNSAIGTKRYSYSLEGNYNFSSVNFTLNASQAGRRMNSEQTLNRVYQDNSTEGIFTPHDYNGLIRKINAGIDFFISDTDELSFKIDYTNDFHSFYNNSSFFNLTNRNNYNYLRRSAHEHLTTIINSNYRKKFSNDHHFLEIDINLNNSSNQYPASDIEDGSFLFNELLQQNFKLTAISFDYSYPISKNSMLEIGSSWNKSALESGKDVILANDTMSFEEFNYSEQLFGLYSLVKTNIHKLSLQTGIRFEHFNSISANTLNSENANLRINNFFPSIHLSYGLNNQNTIMLGYNRRISRPNFHHLDPLQLGNPYFRFIGNPSIEPEYSDNIESSYQLKSNDFNIGFSVFYRHLKNVIQRLNRIEDNVQTVSFKNFGTNTIYGIEFNSNMKLAPFWNASLNANYYHTNITNNNQLTWNTLYSSNIQLKNTFAVHKKVGIDITYRHTPKRQETFYYILPRNRIDIALRAKLLKNSLIANMRIVDLLDRNLMKRFTVAPDFKQDEIWRFQTQTFGVLFSLKYILVKSNGKKRNRKKRIYIHENDIN